MTNLGSRRRPHAAPAPVVLAATLAATLVVAGCSGERDAPPTEVVLLTHDSFVLPPTAKAAFETETGLTLKLLQGGDAGAMLTTALLQAGNPQADVIFGIDDGLLTRALDGDLLEPYSSPELASVDPAYAPPDERVTPIDHGEVCLNIDKAWFAGRGLKPPRTLGDLVQPRYKGLTVVENPATSSPGLAFMLATIARYGEGEGDTGWRGFWRALRANGVQVVDGWEEAYTQQFSGAAGSSGKRPIVVSYATSPAAELIFADPRPAEAPTAAIEDGCFRQVEYAGVLRGAANPEGAEALLDFLLTETFQREVAGAMFVYPVRMGIALPPEFERAAIVPRTPLTLPADEIAANRERWLAEWRKVVIR